MKQLTASRATIIERYWAKTVDTVSQGIDELTAELTKLPPLSGDILIVSAGEVKPLLNPLINQFCQSLEALSECQVHFISAACTSFHAAILDFNKSNSEQALIITLELDLSLQQACLNALGIGNEAKQDGLHVVNGVGFCLVKKAIPDAQSLIVEACNIFSQPKGVAGVQTLLNQLSKYIEKMPDSCQIVSCNIASLWGKRLENALKSRLTQRCNPEFWLPSIEHNTQHFLSLKPTLELQQYQAHLQLGNLLILTLGGGGRVGALRISIGPTDIKKFTDATCSEHSLDTDMHDYHHAIRLKQGSIQDYYQIVKSTLKYPQAQYRGLNNHYFRWTKAADTLDNLEQSYDA